MVYRHGVEGFVGSHRDARPEERGGEAQVFADRRPRQHGGRLVVVLQFQARFVDAPPRSGAETRPAGSPGGRGWQAGVPPGEERAVEQLGCRGAGVRASVAQHHRGPAGCGRGRSRGGGCERRMIQPGSGANTIAPRFSKINCTLR